MTKIPTLIVISCAMDEPEDAPKIIEYINPPKVPYFSGGVRVVVGEDARDTIDFLDNEDSNMVQHAQRELEIIGEDPETIRGILATVRAWSRMGHSGASHAFLLPVLVELLNQHNLAPLTDNPEEWQFIAHEVSGFDGGVWQNRRRAEAFSNDGGKTYYLLSEGAHNFNRKPIHESVKFEASGEAKD